MIKLVRLGTLGACALLGFQAVAVAHGGGYGGKYGGPGDTVPPGAGTGAGTGAPFRSGPGGPTSPGPGSPGLPGPASPGGTVGAGPLAPSTPGDGIAADLTAWQLWWHFNRNPYLNLKAHVHASVVTGSDEFYLGRGERSVSRDSLRPSQASIRGRVVPALVRALERETNNDIVTGCLVALAKIGDRPDAEGPSEMVAHLRPFLTAASQEVAETATVALGILGNDSPEMLDLLVRLLRSDVDGLREQHGVRVSTEVPLRTRAFAAYGLGLVGHRSADDGKRRAIVAALVEQLESGERLGSRDLPVACLSSIGLVGLPLEPQDAAREPGRGEGLATRVDQLRYLLAYYDDEQRDHLNRAHTPVAMARLLADVPPASELRAEVATRLMRDLDPRARARNESRQGAVIALGMLGDCDGDALDVEIRRAILEAADLPDVQARRFALIAAAQVGGRPGAGEGDPLAGVPELRALLSRTLARGKGGASAWAGLAIGVMERALLDARQATSSDVRRSLQAALEGTRSPEEVGAYAIGLGLIADAEARLALRAKLEETRDNETRGLVAVGLGLLDDAGAIESIQGLVRKSRYNPDLLQSSAIALGLLGDKTTVPDLLDMLAEAGSLSSQAALATALGFIGDARSVEPLIAFLEDDSKTARARSFAAVALGNVADKEPLPWNTKLSVNLSYRANTTTLVSPGLGTGILDIL